VVHSGKIRSVQSGLTEPTENLTRLQDNSDHFCRD
jgi:hypothetical protein